MLKHLLFCSAVLLSAPILATPQVTPDTSGTNGALDQALQGSWRDPTNVARDQYRHPEQTLEFFGLTPNMTVVQLWPGTGWYTRNPGAGAERPRPTHRCGGAPKGDSESDGTVKYLAKLKGEPGRSTAK